MKGLPMTDVFEAIAAVQQQYKTGYSDSVSQASVFNISPLYHIDAFDWTVLIIYFSILTVLAIYGVYRVKDVK